MSSLEAATKSVLVSLEIFPSLGTAGVMIDFASVLEFFRPSFSPSPLLVSVSEDEPLMDEASRGSGLIDDGEEPNPDDEGCCFGNSSVGFTADF